MGYSEWSIKTKAVFFSCCLAAIVVSLGAFTRLVDAGLGCPDWPGCYGHVMWPETSAEIAEAQLAFPEAPVDVTKTWPEMVHRYFASTLGFVILCLAVSFWRQRQRSATPIKLPVFLLALVIVQGLFGMWTVTLKLWPQVVTLHLLGGFATLSLLWLLFLRLRQREQIAQKISMGSREQLVKLRRWAVAGLIAVTLQISLGGWTTSNYAALACVDFPKCHGAWLPEVNFTEGFNFAQTIGPNYLGGQLDSSARNAIHWSHRLGALFVTFILIVLIINMMKSKAKKLRTLAGVVLLVLVAQIALGITNVVAVLPLFVAVAHNAVGAVLLLVMVTVNHRLFCCARVSRRDTSMASEKLQDIAG